MDFTDPGVVTTALTAAGAPVWAAAIQMVIQTLKAVPQFERLLDGREKLMCFLLAGVVVVLAFVAALSVTPPAVSLDIIGIVGAFLAWFTVARLGMAVYDDFIKRETRDEPIPVEGARPDESVLAAKGWTG